MANRGGAAQSAPRMKTDAATFEVVKNSLYAAAEEMKVVLAKSGSDAGDDVVDSMGDGGNVPNTSVELGRVAVESLPSLRFNLSIRVV